MADQKVLILTIVDRNYTESIITALHEKHDIRKSIFFLARGHSDTDGEILGIKIQPEREGIYTIVDESKETAVLNTIEEIGKLKTSGQGLALSLNVNQVRGLI